MPDSVQAIVLCEDLQGWVFVRRMLIALGYESRRIRVVPYPGDGRGCGEQHVRESYPDELTRHRSRAARTRTVLAVHVDADRLTVQQRHATLDQELQKQGVAPRAPGETVAVLVPKREIETWIHFFLDSVPVNEQTSYPKYDHESDTWPAAEVFAKHVREGTTPAGAPPSLPVGLAEARRLP
jgi:hypothetical protein